MNTERRLTPWLGITGERVKLRLSDQDWKKWDEARCKIAHVSITVTDTDTGDQYVVSRADCGLGCFCDAVALKLP